MVVLSGICGPLGLRRKWNITKRDAPAECDVTIQQRVCLKRGSGGAEGGKSEFISLSLLSQNVGSMDRHSKENFEFLIEESPHVLFLQEARTTPHELRAMKHRFREVGYFVLWDARRQLACIARHGLNLCQIRGPQCVEGHRLGYCALQLRDTRVLLRNVQYPFEGPSERAKLEQDLEGVDIAHCFTDFGDFNSEPAWRTGDHVLMPNVKTLGKERWLTRLLVVLMLLAVSGS